MVFLLILTLMGLNTESDSSAGEVKNLIRQISKEKITAAFVENITDPRMVEQIAKESGVTAGGELYSDALSKPDGPAPTYLAMFKNNVPKIVAVMKKYNALRLFLILKKYFCHFADDY